MNVLITGASRGIGRALVFEFCKKDTENIIAISRNEAALFTLKEECLELYGKHIRICSQDLTYNAQPNLSTVLKNIDALDIVIHNAGFLINKPFEEQTIEDWKQTFDVNVLSVAHLTRKLLPFLKKSGKAHMVTIGSMGGFQGSSKFAGLSSYSASKGALAVLTECMAAEFADVNISCNCLALGSVNTEMLATAFPGYNAPVNPDQIASFIVDFSMNAHPFINGKIIPVALTSV